MSYLEQFTAYCTWLLPHLKELLNPIFRTSRNGPIISSAPEMRRLLNVSGRSVSRESHRLGEMTDSGETGEWLNFIRCAAAQPFNVIVVCSFIFYIFVTRQPVHHTCDTPSAAHLAYLDKKIAEWKTDVCCETVVYQNWSALKNCPYFFFSFQ